jgi:hypothetical protein
MLSILSSASTTALPVSLTMFLNPEWPNPDLSIGREYKPLMDSKWKRIKRCWGAQGPALDAYKEVADQILELINERDDLDEGEDGFQPWGHTCCMVGSSKKGARPTIIINCRSKVCCRRIIGHIQVL